MAIATFQLFLSASARQAAMALRISASVRHGLLRMIRHVFPLTGNARGVSSCHARAHSIRPWTYFFDFGLARQEALRFSLPVFLSTEACTQLQSSRAVQSASAVMDLHAAGLGSAFFFSSADTPPKASAASTMAAAPIPKHRFNRLVMVVPPRSLASRRQQDDLFNVGMK